MPSKIFRFSKRAHQPSEGKRYLKRAGLFAAGLALLWLALQLVPSSTLQDQTPVYADEAGTVAANAELRSQEKSTGILTGGNIAAFLLLVGGAGFAFFLHRRSTKHADGTAALTSVGELSVGQNERLRLVACGDEVLLIGVTGSQISLLRSYPSETFDAQRRQDEAAAVVDRRHPVPASSHFADVLRQYAGSTLNAQPKSTPC